MILKEVMLCSEMKMELPVGEVKEIEKMGCKGSRREENKEDWECKKTREKNHTEDGKKRRKKGKERDKIRNKQVNK